MSTPTPTIADSPTYTNIPMAGGSSQSTVNNNSNTEEFSEDYLIAKRLQEEEHQMLQNNIDTSTENTDTRWLREQERLMSYYENNRLPAPQDSSVYPYQQYATEDVETARRNDEYYRRQYLSRIQREDPLMFQNQPLTVENQPLTNNQKTEEASCSVQ